MRYFSGWDQFHAELGNHLGYSEWHMVDQDLVDRFAEVTGDRQWIHVHVGRAAQGPFGGTVAHGFLTLSLIPMMMAEIYRVDGLAMAVNYGLNKVRFTAPVPVGSRLRGRMTLLAFETIANGGVQMTWKVTVEREGTDKPACIAESLTRRYP